MQIDSGALIAVCLFGATQTGALVYFAGKVAETLRRHDDELNKLRLECAERRKVSYALAVKEGIQL
jgi:hypothetical protein